MLRCHGNRNLSRCHQPRTPARAKRTCFSGGNSQRIAGAIVRVSCSAGQAQSFSAGGVVAATWRACALGARPGGLRLDSRGCAPLVRGISEYGSCSDQTFSRDPCAVSFLIKFNLDAVTFIMVNECGLPNYSITVNQQKELNPCDAVVRILIVQRLKRHSNHPPVTRTQNRTEVGVFVD